MPQLAGMDFSAGPSQFQSLISDVFSPRATLDSTHCDLDPQKFGPFLLCVSDAWEDIIHQAKRQEPFGITLESLTAKTIIGYIQHLVAAFEKELQNADDSRESLLSLAAAQLSHGTVDIEAVALLKFSVYVWSMCLVDIPRTPPPHLQPKHWTETSANLRQQIELLRPNHHHMPRGLKFPSHFRLYDFDKLSKFSIRWVNDIFQHLTFSDRSMALDDGPNEIQVFHHRRFLTFHADVKSNVFPDGFVEETLRTLDLLLPGQHHGTRLWYGKKAKKHGLDNTACMPGIVVRPHHREIESFPFWGERLSILKETFDQLEPDNVGRFWRDKRKPVQWATFWVAVLVLILTIVFGLVQSIEGALQVYKAYHPS